MPPLLDHLLAALPAPLHRQALRYGFILRRWWFKILKPHVSGVRMVILDAAGQTLLVRHTYGPQSWMVPGGHMRRGEDPIPAARREAQEELAIDLADPHLVEVFTETVRGAQVTVHVVVARATAIPRPDSREIAATAWHPAEALPADASPPLARQLPRWIAAWRAASTALPTNRGSQAAPIGP